MRRNSFEELKMYKKPMSVREVLTEMKDICGLMIGLAYASVLLGDEDLANEVLELEREIDSLLYQLWISAAIAVRDRDDAEAMAGIVKVAVAMDEISNAVSDITQIVVGKLGIHPAVKEVLEKIEPHYRRVVIKPDSYLVGKSIGELDLDINLGIYVIAIRREKELIIDPEDYVKFEPNDVVVVKGPLDCLNDFSMIASGQIKDFKEVIED
ncbi:MAG TPA: potassium channel protein [Candidatus Atribacteria bacterium]|nr:potassium channel protein [Candidatus Atribacteria bacterium]